jgi:hypothetical protein
MVPTFLSVTYGFDFAANILYLLDTVVFGRALETLSNDPSTVISNLSPDPRVEKNMIPVSTLWLLCIVGIR